MDKFEAGAGVGRDSILEVRVELVDSVPDIWRLFEIRSSMTLNQVHQVLQAAFGWEDAHLHRFTTGDPFAPLRPVGRSSGSSAVASRAGVRRTGGQA